MKRIVCFLLTAVIFLSGLLCVPAGAVYNKQVDKEFHSDCFLLLCTDNDEVIFSKDPNKQSRPASLTKVITATIVLDNCKDTTDMVTVPESCITELDDTGSSLSGLKPGETISVYDLLCCLLIQSANDAATTLAYYITGDDRQTFIDKMNALAEELGCKNSHFVNVHGLDDEDQYTSAADMATFFKHAMQYSVFEEIVAKDEYQLPATNMQNTRTIRTTNYTLLPGYKEYHIDHSKGGKTGSTSLAGHNLVMGASNNGYNFIAVAMNAEKKDFDSDGVDENGAFLDCKLMVDWAFENLRLVSIADSERVVGEIPVRFGKGTDYVTLCPSDSAFSLMPKGIDAGSLLIRIDPDTLPDHTTAPVKKGEVICKGIVFFANEEIARIDLVSSTEVKRSFISGISANLSSFFSSTLFKIAAIAVVALLIVLILLTQKRKMNKKKAEKEKGKEKTETTEENED